MTVDSREFTVVILNTLYISKLGILVMYFLFRSSFFFTVGATFSSLCFCCPSADCVLVLKSPSSFFVYPSPFSYLYMLFLLVLFPHLNRSYMDRNLASSAGTERIWIHVFAGCTEVDLLNDFCTTSMLGFSWSISATSTDLCFLTPGKSPHCQHATKITPSTLSVWMGDSGHFFFSINPLVELKK